MGTEIAFGSFDLCIPHYWLGSSNILRHFVCIKSPVSFSGVPLTMVKEEEIVKFWAQHIQTINHIFQSKCHMKARPISILVYSYVQGLDKRRFGKIRLVQFGFDRSDASVFLVPYYHHRVDKRAFRSQFVPDSFHSTQKPHCFMRVYEQVAECGGGGRDLVTDMIRACAPASSAFSFHLASNGTGYIVSPNTGTVPPRQPSPLRIRQRTRRRSQHLRISTPKPLRNGTFSITQATTSQYEHSTAFTLS
jgi:hypothetical protein